MLVSSKKSYEEKMESLKIQKRRKNQCWASISFLLYQFKVKVYRFQKFLRKVRVICKLHKIMNSCKGKGKMMNIYPVQKVREGINLSPYPLYAPCGCKDLNRR
jgi:hypothetical protein